MYMCGGGSLYHVNDVVYVKVNTLTHTVADMRDLCATAIVVVL